MIPAASASASAPGPGPLAARPLRSPAAPALPDRLQAAATALEASFLKEMLTAAGLGRAPGLGGGFGGGGAGEEQFSSFLVEAQAQRIAEAGGIGLARSIVAAMERSHG